MANDMETTGRKMVGMSKKSRPATSGNKNVQSRARRKGHGVPDGMVGRVIAGPDKGTG